jgi:hypothetical protein
MGRRTKDELPVEVGRQGKWCHDGKSSRQGRTYSKQIDDHKKQAFKSKAMEFGAKQRNPKKIKRNVTTQS